LKRKSLGKIKQEVQKVVNKYIRLRDAGKPCISCGKRKKLQAGHYYNVKNYDHFRFDERNINGECAGCNCFNESHLISYGINLNKKIGSIKLDYLHFEVGEYRKDRLNLKYKWDRDMLEEIKKEYQLKIAELENK